MRDFSPFSGPVSSYVSFLFHQCSWVFGGGDGSGGGGGVRVQWWLQPSVLPVVQVSTTGWIFPVICLSSWEVPSVFFLLFQ